MLEGERVTGLDSFYDEVGRSLGVKAWGRNRDALDELLRAGLAVPPGGFTWLWRGVPTLRSALGAFGFEAFVELVKRHGPGGDAEEDRVTLKLLE